ncbi:zinc finger CCCH domain-containing protein 18-like [Saccostrea cucullata]|uniref:zinc finger CCCH domain-containing protein 18-like n=1 Tax=Saccostrea cuccullata TaxID=36930 RepID=UPI002ED65008
MDKLRTKKRGFFAISTSLSSSGDKKRNKGEKQEFTYLKGDKPEFDKVELSNIHGSNGTLNDGTDEEADQGEISGHSSSDLETAVSGSSCDDVHKASRKLQTFAKKSTRRDKKKEKEKQERKEKNKLSMDDFLSKQVEFTTWLEEEKHKNPKEMSSPKRKAYFKTFMKLWNKRKLSQKYYRGSAEIQSPCPANPTRTFSFADDDEEVVSFSRPKSKRLSIEPWGPPDSPFSTFGKTPPKHLQGTNLALLDSQTSLMESSLKEDSHENSGSYKNDSLPKLGEYQIPKNALQMTDAEKTIQSKENSNNEIQPSPSTELPGTPASGMPEKSPVYAVPWKPKPTPRKKPSEVTQVVKSPSPPPVPPKSYKNSERSEAAQQEPQEGVACQTKDVQPGDTRNNEQESGARQGMSESCSSMEVDDQSPTDQGTQGGDGWHSPIKEKPFSPPIKILKSFFPQEQIYAEIESLNAESSEDKEIKNREFVDDDQVFTEPVSELQNDNLLTQSDSPTSASSPESKVKHVVLENLLTTKESRFSFSKYLITPDKYASAPKKHLSLSHNGKENVASKRCLEQQSEVPLLENGCPRKEKPKIPPRNIPKLRSESRVTMMISNGLHNVRNFPIVDNKSIKMKENRDNGKVDLTQRGEIPKSRVRSEGEHDLVGVTESSLGRSERLAEPLDISDNPNTKQQQRFLETDIDSMPLPVMGCKTPPRKRKPLSNLQRSKSLETIIW